MQGAQGSHRVSQRHQSQQGKVLIAANPSVAREAAGDPGPPRYVCCAGLRYACLQIRLEIKSSYASVFNVEKFEVEWAYLDSDQWTSIGSVCLCTNSPAVWPHTRGPGLAAHPCSPAGTRRPYSNARNRDKRQQSVLRARNTPDPYAAPLRQRAPPGAQACSAWCLAMQGQRPATPDSGPY